MFKRLLCVLIVAVMMGPQVAPAQAEQVTVFAAASMKTALEKIIDDFEKASGIDVTLSVAGSSVLARQIEYGAPANVFISANSDWMDHLENAGRISGESRVDLVGNTLVLIGREGGQVEVSENLNLLQLLGSGRLAMALVEAVPAGIYGKAALTSLGLWDDVQTKVAQVDNVRAALALVAQGAAPIGIVYASDAHADPRVVVLGQFPKMSHPPIHYPAAVVTGRMTNGALSFLNYLQSQPARAIFGAQGFQVLED